MQATRESSDNTVILTVLITNKYNLLKESWVVK